MNALKEHFSSIGRAISSNAGYVMGFLFIIVALIAIAFFFEKMAQRSKDVDEPILTTRKMAMIGMFSAVATILMMFEIPLFFAPGFYKLDFSELPILIGSLAFGPVSGVLMEFVKVLLKLLIKGTSTAFVGDLANFAVGCSFILPASIIYNYKKTKTNAITGLVIATVIITVFGTVFNAVYLLPAFAALYGMPMDALLAMGVEANPLVKEGDVVTFVIACVAPLNLIKGTLNALVTMLVYKKLSPILKTDPMVSVPKVKAAN